MDNSTEEIISEIKQVLQGNPTPNFQPIENKFHQTILYPEQYQSIRDYLKLGFTHYKLRQFKLVFFIFITNSKIQTSSQLVNNYQEICAKHTEFQNSQQSLGFQAVYKIIDQILSNFQQNLEEIFTYQHSSFDDFAINLNTTYFKNSKLTDDLDFINLLILNVFPNFDTFFSTQTRDFKNLIFSPQHTKLPVLVNVSHKYSQKFSVQRKKQFDTDWTNTFLEQFNLLLQQYMKFGFIIDNFEFFAQQEDFDHEKFNQLNYTNFVQVEAPGCVLYPKLFPYFITENLAREIVFIARVSKLVRFQQAAPELINILHFINQIQLTYQNHLEFDLEISKLRLQISTLLWRDLLSRNQISLDISQFVSLSCMQNSAIFDILLSSSNEFISKPWLFTKDIAFTQFKVGKQSHCEIELNAILDIESGKEMNCLRLVQIPSESQLLQEVKLQEYAFNLGGKMYFDVDGYFYGVKFTGTQSNFFGQVSSNQNGTLIPYILLNFKPIQSCNLLLLSPQIMCSFSRIFRNLLFIKYYSNYQLGISSRLIQYKKLFLQLQNFQNKNPHFMRYSDQNSNIAVQISLMSKVFRINNLINQIFQQLQISISSKISSQIQIFDSFQKNDFLEVQKNLIYLATEISSIVLLNDRAASNIVVQFFSLIPKFESLLNNSSVFFEKQMQYGRVNDQMISQITNTNLFLEDILKVQDSLQIILNFK